MTQRTTGSLMSELNGYADGKREGQHGLPRGVRPADGFGRQDDLGTEAEPAVLRPLSVSAHTS